MVTNIKKDYIFYSIVILFAIFFIIMTPQIKITNGSFIIGPRTWPYILLTLMLILGSFGMIKSYMKSKKMKATESTINNENKESEKTLFKLSMPMVSLVSVVLYVILLNALGFILSTLLFLYGITFILGEKKQLNAIIFSIVTTGVFVLLFSVVLQIPLPRGLGFFRQFSLLFY